MKQNTITEEESNAIVIIRATAMFSIILCHLFQAYQNYLTCFFNVGVQVFLIMSGYLYGKKEITNWIVWYKKRYLKLYIPYVIVVVSVFTMLFIFTTERIKWYQLLAYLTNIDGIRQIFDIPELKVSGMRHLWFMTAIMFAYFSTPILQRLKQYSTQSLIIMLTLVVPSYYVLPPRILWGLEWFWLYAFGYFFANLSIRNKKWIICLFFLGYMIIVFRIREITDIALWTRIGRCHHCALGILLFTLGITYIKTSRTCPTKMMRVFRWFNRYSYEIYLTHFVVMVGVFSLSQVTGSLFVNILLMLIVTAILTFMLVKVTRFFTMTYHCIK